ncbi:hypothetical protein Tco_1352731 [Tanacetum coccineum]
MSPSVSLIMFEEDQAVGVTALPKFDMPSYESEMTSKDVKSLALRHGIPLDLHPVALRKRRAISDAMAWRHHDSDVNDPVPEDGFQASDVQLLTEWVVDLRPVASGLLFYEELAITWGFSGFRPVFKDTEGNVVTMSEYLCFLFLSAYSKKDSHQKEVKVEDPKIVAIRERKVRAAAKKREIKWKGGDGGEGSRPATKRKKTVARKDGSAAFEDTSSLEPIQSINPTSPTSVISETVESRENQPSHASPRGSANHFGALAQTDILERFENLQTGFDELVESHAECGGLAGKLVQSRLDVKHSSDLYNSLSDRFKAFRSEHEGCVRRLEASENQNRELSQVNKDQALQIKELADTLAKKDSALIYAERINVEQAQKKERLVSQLGRVKMEKFDFGWDKGLAEEDLLELKGIMEGFDAYDDKRMKVEYDKLFEKRYLL